MRKLKKCKSCKKNVLAKLNTCPRCGYIQDDKTRKREAKMIEEIYNERRKEDKRRNKS